MYIVNHHQVKNHFLFYTYFFLIINCLFVVLNLSGCTIEVEPEIESDISPTTSVNQNLGVMSGIWLLTSYARDQEIVLLLLEVKQEGESAKVGVKEMAPGRKPLGVKAIKFQPETGRVDLNFFDTKGDIFFKGKLDGDEIAGITMMSSGEIAFSKLSKTAVLTLEGQGKITEVPEAADFLKATEAKDKTTGLKTFIEAHPKSHLTFKAYELLFDESSYNKKPESEVIEKFNQWKEAGQKWGLELLPAMYAKSIGQLGNTGYSFDLLQKMESEFQELAGKENLKFDQSEQKQVDFGKATSKLNSTDEIIQEEGVKELELLVEKNPMELMVLYGIVVHYFSKEKWEKVLEKAAPFLSLPLMEQLINQNNQQYSGYIPPSNLFIKAWEKLNKDNKELEAFLDNSYLRALDLHTGKPAKAVLKEQPLKPLLLELHTGISCEKCVAIEVASQQIQQKYGPENVAILRFHQHGEQGDPLTLPEGEQRFQFISQALGQKSGVMPMLLVNGLNQSDIAGGLAEAKELYTKISKSIDDQIYLAPVVNFKTMINVNGDSIKVEVVGDKLLPDSPDLKFYLNIILAEKNVKLIAPNGISKHDYVVRSMAYGSNGKPYTDQTLNFSHEFDVKTLRYKQENYLQKYEKSKDGKFASHPIEMKKLAVVVFLQSYVTGHVVNTYVKELVEDFGISSDSKTENGQIDKTDKKQIPPVPSLPE